MKKKILIIGGGVAGLSAGIIGQRSGFDTVIYEKNTVAGGSCSGWYRQGYAIDNCLHWLTGSKKGTSTCDLWEELGVINDNTKIIRRDCFWSSEYDGKTVTLWPDAEKTRAEMLELAPEDSLEINTFIDLVKLGSQVIESGITPKNIAKAFNAHESVLSNKEFFTHAMRYLGMNNIAWSEKFKSPLLKSLILDFCPKEYESYWLILSYSFYASGNADIIEGGSIQIANSLRDMYIKEGGQLKLGTTVSKVVIDRQKFAFDKQTFAEMKTLMRLDDKTFEDAFFQKASGILLENGETISADYIICACDINFTFKHLLNKKYMPLNLKAIYDNKQAYPLYSAFQVAFAVDSEFEEIPDSLSFECAPFDAAHQRYNRIGVKNYRKYGDYIAPKGHTVIQVSLDQYAKDFNYWKRLYQTDTTRYNQAKANVATAIENAIVTRFPNYEGRLRLLDVWTPYTYKRRNNDTQGAFMRYITTALSINVIIPSEVMGLDNVYLAGHWLMYPGGLPTAAFTGKDAINRIVTKEEKRAKGFSIPIPFKKKSVNEVEVLSD